MRRYSLACDLMMVVVVVMVVVVELRLRLLQWGGSTSNWSASACTADVWV